MSFSFKKKFGQNFLVNFEVVKKILSAIPECQEVFEIGPGSGMLTKGLINKGFKVKGIEIDSECVDMLKKIDSPNLEIINQNALDFEFSESGVVGNLPYNISSLIIEKFVKRPMQFCIFMLQKEVADRIIATSGKKYGRISLLAQARYKIEVITKAAPRDFFPQPKVFSKVLKFVPHGFFQDLDIEKLENLTKILFMHRRKKLNNIKKTDDKIFNLLEQSGVNLDLRAEDLDKEVVYKMAQKL